jgi:hypothetical protein
MKAKVELVIGVSSVQRDSTYAVQVVFSNEEEEKRFMDIIRKNFYYPVPATLDL